MGCKIIKKNEYLIDGFPRNLDNINEWEETFGNSITIKKVFFFECDESAMIERISKRSKNSERSDDNLEALKTRIKIFINETLNMIEFLNKTGFVQKV